MATPVIKVYEAFLARIEADDWTAQEDLETAEKDWEQFLRMGIFRFKYPRVSLELNEVQSDFSDSDDLVFSLEFIEDLNQDEIQLLALYMKHEWIKRCVASWRNVKSLWSDREFSQANYLDKLTKLEQNVALEVKKAEGIYDRSANKRPVETFKRLAGKH